MLDDTFIVINFTLHLLRSVVIVFNGRSRSHVCAVIYILLLHVYFMSVVNGVIRRFLNDKKTFYGI